MGLQGKLELLWAYFIETPYLTMIRKIFHLNVYTYVLSIPKSPINIIHKPTLNLPSFIYIYML